MTEAELQAAVIDLAHLLGWTVAHFRGVRVQRANGSMYYATPVGADGVGFPDLVLVRERVIFAELKTQRGAVKPEQKEWLASLHRAGAECYLWRPAQWTDGTIERVLRTSVPSTP